MFWQKVYTVEDIIEERDPSSYRETFTLKDRSYTVSLPVDTRTKDRVYMDLIHNANPQHINMQTAYLLSTLSNAITCPLEDAPKLLGYGDIRSKIATIRLANGR